MAIGHWQLLILVVIVLVFFVGPKKLPDIGKSLGKSIRNFKKALNEEEDTLDVTNSAKAERIESQSEDETAKSKSTEKDKA